MAELDDVSRYKDAKISNIETPSNTNSDIWVHKNVKNIEIKTIADKTMGNEPSDPNTGSDGIYDGVINRATRKVIKKMIRVSQMSRFVDLIPNPKVMAKKFVLDIVLVMKDAKLIISRMNEMLDEYANIPFQYLTTQVDSFTSSIQTEINKQISPYTSFVDNTFDVATGVLQIGSGSLDIAVDVAKKVTNTGSDTVKKISQMSIGEMVNLAQNSSTILNNDDITNLQKLEMMDSVIISNQSDFIEKNDTLSSLSGIIGEDINSVQSNNTKVVTNSNGVKKSDDVVETNTNDGENGIGGSIMSGLNNIVNSTQYILNNIDNGNGESKTNNLVSEELNNVTKKVTSAQNTIRDAINKPIDYVTTKPNEFLNDLIQKLSDMVKGLQKSIDDAIGDSTGLSSNPVWLQALENIASTNVIGKDDGTKVAAAAADLLQSIIKEFSIGKCTTAFFGIIASSALILTGLDELPSININMIMDEIRGKKDDEFKLPNGLTLKDIETYGGLGDDTKMLNRKSMWQNMMLYVKYYPSIYLNNLDKEVEEERKKQRKRNCAARLNQKNSSVNYTSDNVTDEMLKENEGNFDEPKYNELLKEVLVNRGIINRSTGKFNDDNEEVSVIKVIEKRKRNAVKAKRVQRFKDSLKIMFNELISKCQKLIDRLVVEWTNMVNTYKNAIDEIKNYFENGGEGEAIIDEYINDINRNCDKIVELCKKIAKQTWNCTGKTIQPPSLGMCFPNFIYKIYSFIMDIETVLKFVKDSLDCVMAIIADVRSLIEMMLTGLAALKESLDGWLDIFNFADIKNVINGLIKTVSDGINSAVNNMENSLYPVYMKDTELYDRLIKSFEKIIDKMGDKDAYLLKSDLDELSSVMDVCKGYEYLKDNPMNINYKGDNTLFKHMTKYEESGFGMMVQQYAYMDSNNELLYTNSTKDESLNYVYTFSDYAINSDAEYLGSKIKGTSTQSRLGSIFGIFLENIKNIIVAYKSPRFSTTIQPLSGISFIGSGGDDVNVRDVENIASYVYFHPDTLHFNGEEGYGYIIENAADAGNKNNNGVIKLKSNFTLKWSDESRDNIKNEDGYDGKENAYWAFYWCTVPNNPNNGNDDNWEDHWFIEPYSSNNGNGLYRQIQNGSVVKITDANGNKQSVFIKDANVRVGDYVNVNGEMYLIGS